MSVCRARCVEVVMVVVVLLLLLAIRIAGWSRGTRSPSAAAVLTIRTHRFLSRSRGDDADDELRGELLGIKKLSNFV